MLNVYVTMEALVQLGRVALHLSDNAVVPKSCMLPITPT
jgi:hypothetical protein